MAAPQKVRAGETWQPSASDHNAFVGAWQYVQRMLRSGGARVGRNAWGTGIVSMRNSSGADRDRFDVLGIDAPTITPSDNLAQFQGQICLDGVTPTLGHMGRFAVLLEPVKAGRITPWAMVAGVTVAKVNFRPAGDHQFCEAAGGEAGALETLAGGSARLLWPTTGSGVEWSVIRLCDGNEPVRIELAEDHPTRGIPFEVWLERWDPGTAMPMYDRSRTFRAIDWYYGVPYPEQCATGHARWKLDDQYGRILDVIGMDCESPGCYH